jgi:dihydroxyacetone kinase-like predicted kinase
MTQNVHAQHGDSRIEELRQKYGDMAGMKVEDLRDKAKQAGIDRTSEKRKEELLQALSNQRGGGKRR